MFQLGCDSGSVDVVAQNEGAFEVCDRVFLLDQTERWQERKINSSNQMQHIVFQVNGDGLFRDARHVGLKDQSAVGLMDVDER